MKKLTKPGNELAGQVALVTGSAQGIGAGIARKFAEHGSRVMIHGLERKQGEKTAAIMRAAGFKVELATGDLKDEALCRSLVRQTVERLGRIDILVNNAAVTHRGNIENTSVALWDEILDTNIRAPFILCQEAVKYMKVGGKGRRAGAASCKCIINIGSVNAYVGQSKLLAYSASKGALMTFTKNLASYLTQYRIRVNQINPGWVLTEGERRVESVTEGKGPGWLKDALKTRPFGRMLYPEDIARAALFLATNELLTGAVLDYEQLPIGSLPELL
jgi:NAD(P)-dependent dehydrogenase (short-subunit alcohol dehydrogenase family)